MPRTFPLACPGGCPVPGAPAGFDFHAWQTAFFGGKIENCERQIESSAMKIKTVVDLFSGAGGMSYGFHAHPLFKIIGAIDAQHGKPSSGNGTLECNKTYQKNIGIEPLDEDISLMAKETLLSYLSYRGRPINVDVLISCAPCTGLSRTIRRNLVEDDPRNSLVARSADFVEWLMPSVFLMENVGELIEGRFNYHYKNLRTRLERLGYQVNGSVHSLNEFGLPQRRRRALVIGVKKPLHLQTINAMWDGYEVKKEATFVRRAIGKLPLIEAGRQSKKDKMHVSPNLSQKGLERLARIPKDGGSWPDLLKVPDGFHYLIPSMKRNVDKGKVGPHPDVYGRLAWDQSAVTIKRECGHTGNGRYAHPEQNRHCTVRELAILQGFPRDYEFVASSLSNMYRHIGDAVPPLISHQLAWVCDWIFTGKRPTMNKIVLPNTSLRPEDILKAGWHQLELDRS